MTLTRSVVFVAVVAMLYSFAPNALAKPDAKQAATKVGANDVVAIKSKGGGADKNIKQERGANSTHQSRAMGAPSSNGLVHIKNNTNWFADLYIDSKYVGTVPSSGKIEIPCSPGQSITLYGKAAFEDGTFCAWGPHTYTVPDETPLVWNLKQ